MVELELEKTYLAKRLPKDIETCAHREILDIYMPVNERHPILRLRRKGTAEKGYSYEMTKKEPDVEGDASKQTEHTIKLTAAEFEALATAPGKRARKIRYDFPYKGVKAEVAVFKDALEGLVLVDVEFRDAKALAAFGMPDFCLADVTNDEIFAGGMLCGKSYGDIAARLTELGYDRIVQS